MFVTVEGVEGAGKSTLLDMLAREMENRSIAFLRTREPGGCGLGKNLRSLLLDTSSMMDRQAELFLFLADRAQHVAEVIRPALDRGEWVLCDRYVDSTIAYQGYGRGMDIAMLQLLNEYAAGGLWPEKTLLLDLPVDVGLARAIARNGREGLTQKEGRFEAEALAFHQRIREGFLERASHWPERFVVLDAERSPEEILEKALKALALA